MNKPINYTKNSRVVISLGGSIIVPDEIDYEFLLNFREFIVTKISEGMKFLIVCGGGKTGMRYIEAAKKVVSVANDDLDWLGIHSTRLNAHLLRTIFKDISYPIIITHHDEKFDVEEPLVIAGGSKPGWSTDFVAASLAVNNGYKDVINMSNIDMVYTTDPNGVDGANAKPLEKTTWTDLQKMVGTKWTPNLSGPFDPIATKLGGENDLRLVVINGRNMSNLKKLFSEQEFTGTFVTS